MEFFNQFLDMRAKNFNYSKNVELRNSKPIKYSKTREKNVEKSMNLPPLPLRGASESAVGYMYQNW